MEIIRRMKKLSVIFAIMVAVLTSCGPKVTVCDNPLTYTDIPDNDVIRVGNDYYMISTTMYFCPGAPIMHSKDLVHWEIVSYVYDCLNDDDVYNLHDGKHAYGCGQWAASLRYHDGMYYALFIAKDQHCTFIYKTKDITSSYWEKTVIDEAFHDASLLFDDDGRVYVVWGNGELYIAELEPDLSGLKEGGVRQLLIDSPREGVMLRAEGSHIYHIGDYYYILEIDWPFRGVRTETCWRSKELLGEYESKTVLQGTLDDKKTGVAQGAIFETQKGDWYAMMFMDHGAVGRIPTLQPVTWVDGWPIMGDNGVPVSSFEVNLKPCSENYTWASDEFDTSELALVWQWNHKPIDSCWSLTERPGWMRLSTEGLATGIKDARNTLTQRTVGPACSSAVKLDASGLQPGDHAGICAFQSRYCTIGVQVDSLGAKSLVGADFEGEIFREPLTGDEVYLKLIYDFNSDKATMAYSYDGEAWQSPDYNLQMRFTLDFFTGYRTALFCYSTITPGGHADFDWFHQQAI